MAGTISMSTDLRVATFVPSAPYPAGVSMAVYISYFAQIQDLAGNALPAQVFGFTTGFASDTVAPTVVVVSPSNGLTGVPTNVTVMVDFSEPVDGVGLAGQIVLKAGTTPVASSLALSNANQRVTLTPQAPLLASTAHTLTITGVKDLVGNAMTAPVNVGFTTGAGADLTPPTATGSNPPANATGVPTNTVVTVNFSERINPLTINDSSFRLTVNNTGAPVAGTIAVAANALSATFTPSAALAPSTVYRMYVCYQTCPTDLAGNSFSFQFQSAFTTGP
jgi:hypothetical protein